MRSILFTLVGIRTKTIMIIAITAALVGGALLLSPVFALHTAGPLAFWDFEDGTDPTSDTSHGADCDIDSFGAGGASFNGVGIANVGSDSLKFDGVDDFCDAPDPGGANNLDGLSGLTLSACIENDILTGGSDMIVSKYDTNTAHVSYYLSTVNDELRIFVGKNSGSFAFETTTTMPIAAGTVYHVAGTWDGISLKLYVDGVLQASSTFTNGPFPSTMLDSTVDVSIGSAVADQFGNRFAFFDGTIDDVRIFDRALTAQEIIDIFNAGSGGECKKQPPMDDPEIEKYYTFTNNNWNDLRCSGVINGTGHCVAEDLPGDDDGPLLPIDRIPNIFLDDDIFADQLPTNATGAFLLNGTEKGRKTVVTPGQYIAVSNVTVPIEQTIWVEEDFADCLDIGKVNPKKVPGGVQVVMILPNGDVIDIDDDLADGIGGSITLDVDGNAMVHVDDVPAGAQVLVMVKFSPLKNQNMIGLECTNFENLLDFEENVIGTAPAILKIQQKP